MAFFLQDCQEEDQGGQEQDPDRADGKPALEGDPGLVQGPQGAVEAEEKAQEAKQRKKDMIQETAIDIRAPTKPSARAKPKKYKSGRFVPKTAKNVIDDFGILHDKMHELESMQSKS